MKHGFGFLSGWALPCSLFLLAVTWRLSGLSPTVISFFGTVLLLHTSKAKSEVTRQIAGVTYLVALTLAQAAFYFRSGWLLVSCVVMMVLAPLAEILEEV